MKRPEAEQIVWKELKARKRVCYSDFLGRMPFKMYENIAEELEFRRLAKFSADRHASDGELDITLTLTWWGWFTREYRGQIFYVEEHLQ